MTRRVDCPVCSAILQASDQRKASFGGEFLTCSCGFSIHRTHRLDPEMREYLRRRFLNQPAERPVHKVATVTPEGRCSECRGQFVEAEQGGGFPGEFLICDNCGATVHRNLMPEEQARAAREWEEIRNRRRQQPQPPGQKEPARPPEPAKLATPELGPGPYLTTARSLDGKRLVGLPQSWGAIEIWHEGRPRPMSHPHYPNGFHAAFRCLPQDKPLEALRGELVEVYTVVFHQIKSREASPFCQFRRRHLLEPLRLVAERVAPTGQTLFELLHFPQKGALPTEVLYLDNLVRSLFTLKLFRTSQARLLSLEGIGTRPGRIGYAHDQVDSGLTAQTL